MGTIAAPSALNSEESPRSPADPERTCLQVNGEWVWWHSAAGLAIPATRQYMLGE